MFLKDNLNEHEQMHYINYLFFEIRSAVSAFHFFRCELVLVGS